MAAESMPAQGSTYYSDLMLERMAKRDFTVAVMGLGYVGLPLVSTFHDAGFVVMGFDVDQKKIDKLNAGESYILHIPDDNIGLLAKSSRFTATSNFNRLANADAILICVPTPVGKHNEPDMKYVFGSVNTIAKVLRAGQLIVLESTTYPGTTDEEMVEILDKKGFVCGSEYFVAYSPEREDPGNKHFSAANIPKLVGGVGKRAGQLAHALYSSAFAKAHLVSSARVAECSKLVENIYRSVNIALVNELKVVFEKLGVDVWEVLDAAETKPFGFKRFNPGPGIGGHCIPVDPFYLTWKAKEVGTDSQFIRLAGEVNAHMPAYVVSKVQEVLNLDTKSVNASQILLLGIAYKADVDDVRESPALVIWDLLRGCGAEVTYHDTFIPQLGVTRAHPDLAGRESIAFTRETIADQDLVLLLTNHSTVNYRLLEGCSCPIVDTRNAIPKDLQDIRLFKA